MKNCEKNVKKKSNSAPGYDMMGRTQPAFYPAAGNDKGNGWNDMTGKDSRIKIPEKAQHIIDVLESHGFEGYVVGGCVRDAILGRTPNDWDITTSASPEEVKALFPHTIDTGIAHGTVTVLSDHEPYEVTTYRIDGAYEDARHPSSVTFTRSLEEDLKRRDFTINAMAYNERDGLVDLFGGNEDLKAGVIRCVGEARERFSEDALRILRAVRFAAQLDFDIEEKTGQAAGELAQNLRRISAERIWTELVKLLVSDHPQKIEDARALGITEVILPEFDALFTCPLLGTGQSSVEEAPFRQAEAGQAQGGQGQEGQAEGRQAKDGQAQDCGSWEAPAATTWNAGTHTLAALKYVEADKVLRLTMLLHDMGKPVVETQYKDGRIKYPGHAAKGEEIAGAILKRLRADRDTMDKVRRLIRYHSVMPSFDPAGVRKLAHEIGPDLFGLWLKVKYADAMAHDPQSARSKAAAVERVAGIWQDICKRHDPLTLKDLAVTGGDLIRAGMKPGKELGTALEMLLGLVLEEPERNTAGYLLEVIRTEPVKSDTGVTG